MNQSLFIDKNKTGSASARAVVLHGRLLDRGSRHSTGLHHRPADRAWACVSGRGNPFRNRSWNWKTTVLEEWNNDKNLAGMLKEIPLDNPKSELRIT